MIRDFNHVLSKIGRANTLASEIIAQLKARFDDEVDDTAKPHKVNLDSMSLLDKMRMWGSKSSVQHPEVKPEESDLFQGVESDDEDEPMAPPELSTYSKVILDSTAYQWLLAGLTKESSFHWGAGHPNVMVDEVRDKILRKLPTGTISKNRPPRIFRVIFRLPWQPLQARLDEGHSKSRSKSRIAWGPPSLSDVLVLTCSSDDEMQATTVKQYFEQTWPDGGVQILGSLQMLLDRRIGSHSFSGMTLGSPAPTRISQMLIMLQLPRPIRSRLNLLLMDHIL